jgi:hypothetical protein
MEDVPFAAVKAIVTLLVLGGVMGYLVWDAMRNRPE